MGTWGTGLYSDDLAADLRGEFRDLVGEGFTAEQAVEKLAADYASSLVDPDERPVFWLAVADCAWRLGRPVERATAEALRIIASGADLARWKGSREKGRRQAVLERLAASLQSPAPPERRVSKPFKAANQWSVGELVAYRLQSGRFALLRVIGHHADKGGRHAVCELLDWCGDEAPGAERFGRLARARLRVRKSVPPWNVSQFLVGEPRRPTDAARFRAIGVRAKPGQRAGGYSVFVFPHFDRQLRDIFGIE